MSRNNDGDKIQEEFSCAACKHPDNAENMLVCDSCSTWFHFGCAKVDESVANQPWKCISCGTLNQEVQTEAVYETALQKSTLRVPANGGKSSKASDINRPSTNTRSKKLASKDSVSVASSVKDRAIQIEIKMLEEQERIKEQELKEEKEMKQKKLMLEKQLRDRELALEAKKLEEEKAFQEKQLADEEKFRKARAEMRQQSLEKKKSLVRQLSQRGSDVGSVCRSEAEKSVEKVEKWLQESGKPTEGDKKKSTAPANGSGNVPDEKHEIPIFNDVPHPVPGKSRSNSKDNEHPKEPNTGKGDNNEPAVEMGPTSRQLAARQVMGKDLPVFSGNPEEWPIWISNFERSTATCGFSQDENLMRLQRCLKGSALEMVRSRLLSPNSVSHVIKALKLRYGRPETLIKALTEKIRNLPPPRMDNLESIVDFGMAVDNLVEHLKNANQQSHLTNPSLLHDLVGKLPVDYRLKWSAFKSSVEEVNLGTFGSFMSALVELAFEVMDDTPTGKTSKGVQSKPKDRSYVQAHSEHPSAGSEAGPSSSNSNTITPSEQPRKICAFCKMEGHRVADCFKFKALNIDERFQIVSENSLCRTCLNQHGKWPCKTWRGCGIEGCRLRHHTLLHSSTPSVPTVVSTSHAGQQTSSGPFFRILPVTLYGEHCKLDVYAFVDEGSQLTLLDDAVAEKLGITGPIETLNLQWTGNITRNEPNSKRIRMEISGCKLAKRYKLFDARTVASLRLPMQSLRYQDLAISHPHLRGLPISDYEDVTPKLLIGLDNLKLTVPLKIREGGWGQPMAAKCRLGWSIYGCTQSIPEPFTCGFHVGGWTNPETDDLNQLVRDYITLDNSGVVPPLAPLESEEDKRARMLLESTTKRIGNRFETALLWKWDDIAFPNSYGMGYRRLRSLEKRLSKDPQLYDCVRQQMREYQAKGYAHQATDEELANTSPEKCWYLPLGVVLNPKKPNKVRIIWDAAAKVNGISLNSALLKGPDLLASLIAVFFHFRLYAYALTGDIKEMFHRFFIRLADRQFLRFLWRDHATLEVVVFIMDVAIFGATCSPSSAQYIKNLNAQEFADQYPRAVAAIIDYHYVDDYLDSFPTAEEAMKVGSEVKRIHAEGGFEIRNFLSNDPEIAAQVGTASKEMEKSINAEKDENIESVLGMKWIPSGDELTYSFVLREDLKHVLDEAHTPTKREVLRVVMSLFDPLGLISFFLIHGRTLMQDIWASGTDWDETINSTLCGQWRRWTALLGELNSVRIPRCYFSGAGYETYSTLEIHVFVDASNSAYASVVYFRVETTQGPTVALVAGKAKVAPLKMMSIPRLELQGAVLGSRLLNSVMAMHKLPVTRRVLWTDSEIVLAWLRSDSRKYQQFVGFRVAEILSTTEVQEWRKIESELNVADQATKWGGGPNLNANNPWFSGPKFLSKPESFWPQQRTVPFSTEEEIRKVNVHMRTQPLIETTRFSRWEKLERTVALVHRFIDNLKRKRQGMQLEFGILKQEELAKAQITLCKQAQQEYYAEEVEQLSGNELQMDHSAVSRSSHIFKLWPFMDQCGVMRMRGRIDAAPYVAYAAKHPTILPHQSWITFLLADKFHRRFRHANRETVINEMRQEYNIPKMRALVARVTRECVYCRIRNAIPRSPPMAPLPNVRVTPFVRPFTFVGLDYFGPMLVKVGRSNVKRWIALFTCLSIRAIHMEVVHSMSTESCVLAVRRFVSRRGSPAEFFSDNGTNFHGANNQLKMEIQDREKTLASVFTNANTRWTFNPPGAPHMGGVWERMVRSVKVAIGAIVEAPRKPDDETLETVIIEAEAMINTRPLTYIPVESADQEALTPNHFLLGSSSGVKQLPVHPMDYRMTLRSSWKLAQHLADEFWKRWLKEYLPVISRRSKWFKNVKDIEEGDLVFVVDGIVRNQWIRGRVERVAVGTDGRVRQAWVRTRGGVIRRPVVKLALIDVMDNGGPELGDCSGPRAGECDGEKLPNITAL